MILDPDVPMFLNRFPLGLLLLALGVIGSIVFSFLSPACNGKNYDASGCQAALVMNDAIESFILAAMIAATIWVIFSRSCVTIIV